MAFIWKIRQVKGKNLLREDILILKIRERLRYILSLKDNPRHVAISFGVGVFLGMSPLLGIHTLLGLLFSAVFRLNKFVTIVGVYITNPWTIIPIYSFGTWCGMKLLGVEGIATNIQWDSLSFFNVMAELKELLMPFVVGTFFLGAISSVLSYVFILFLLKKKSHV